MPAATIQLGEEGLRADEKAEKMPKRIHRIGLIHRLIHCEPTALDEIRQVFELLSDHACSIGSNAALIDVPLVIFFGSVGV